MDWKKYFCPICGIDFTDDDDVVVCPDCGTPHHRECWMKTGHCANEALHGTEDSLECTYKKASSDTDVVPEIVADDNKETFNPQINLPYNSGFNVENDQENTEQAPPRPSLFIKGRPGVLYEIALRKNQKYYIPRFIVMDQGVKGTGWNIMAFLFPFAWSLYRKMYKLSALVLAVYIAIMGVTVYSVMMDKPLMESFNACYEEDPGFLTKVAAYSNEENGATLTQNQQEFYKHTLEFAPPAYITWGTVIAGWIMKLTVAIMANKLYLEKITKSIEKAEAKGLEGDTLKMFLYRKHGVLPLIIVLIIGFFEYTVM